MKGEARLLGLWWEGRINDENRMGMCERVKALQAMVISISITGAGVCVCVKSEAYLRGLRWQRRNAL